MPATAMDYVDDLLEAVREGSRVFASIDDVAAAHRPSLGVWSAKEIVGHLIDSACNNHLRFVQAQWREDLVFAGYDQERWVESQRYQDAPWPELVTLWQSYNVHLARVMKATPDALRLRVHATHNLHQIGWRATSEGAPATLDDLMRDYVEHLRHHLQQIASRLTAARM